MNWLHFVPTFLHTSRMRLVVRHFLMLFSAFRSSLIFSTFFSALQNRFSVTNRVGGHIESDVTLPPIWPSFIITIANVGSTLGNELQRVASPEHENGPAVWDGPDQKNKRPSSERLLISFPWPPFSQSWDSAVSFNPLEQYLWFWSLLAFGVAHSQTTDERSVKSASCE